jgi:hypothetical protein
VGCNGRKTNKQTNNNKQTNKQTNNNNQAGPIRAKSEFSVQLFFLTNQTHQLSKFYSVIKLYMFRASSLPTIRSFYCTFGTGKFHVGFDDRFQTQSGWNWMVNKKKSVTMHGNTNINFSVQHLMQASKAKFCRNALSTFANARHDLATVPSLLSGHLF